MRQLAEEGYHDITLLGQNVNSYGKDLEEPMDFADLLEQVNAIPGDFLVRFMTSHPKDATHKLFETMARCEKVAPVLHLPFQAGNDRVLKVMNRRHTRAQYLERSGISSPSSRTSCSPPTSSWASRGRPQRSLRTR